MNSTIERTASWPCHKIWTCIKKQRIEVLFLSKTFSVHSFISLIPTFNHFVNIVHYAGRSQTFQNEGWQGRGLRGDSEGADCDSKWRLSMDLCTKCDFIWGQEGGRVSAGDSHPSLTLWLRHRHYVKLK